MFMVGCLMTFFAVVVVSQENGLSKAVTNPNSRQGQEIPCNSACTKKIKKSGGCLFNATQQFECSNQDHCHHLTDNETLNFENCLSITSVTIKAFLAVH